MKTLGVVSTAVLFLLLGNPAPGWAGSLQQDEAKSPQQPEPKPEKREEKRSPQGQMKQEEKKTQEQKHAQHQEPSGNRAAAEKGGVRIPQEKFRAHFGREHTFVINRPIIVEGVPRFQVSGFWFAIVEPWPVAWAYTDPCYIEFVDGAYYLFDPLYPGVRVLVVVAA